MKICPVGAELLCADGWTDVTKLTVAFHNFANTPKNGLQKDIVRFNFGVKVFITTLVIFCLT